jgi:hypothetical protein
MRSLHFSIYLILPAALGPEIDSASNRNEYQEFSWVGDEEAPLFIVPLEAQFGKRTLLK